MRIIDADELKEIIQGNENFIDWQKEEIIFCIDCVNTVDRILALPDEVIENYKQFEDECIAKGFTFNSLIVAREKQIPKKIKVEQWTYTKCECGHEFSMGGFDGYYRVPLDNRTKYCPSCGQRLEWEE